MNLNALSRPLRNFRLLPIALALAIPALPAFAASLWEDEEFVARFSATYGVRGDLEPKVTREEQVLLREVATHLPGRPRQAAALLAGAIRPGSSAGLDFTLGNLHFQLDEFEEAEGHYRAAIGKFPDFLRAHKNLGLVLARQERFGEATSALSRALTLGSADGDTYGLLGFSHLQQGHPVSAEAAYRQALLFEPENANWQVGLAQALQGQDRHPEAAALLAELTSRHPGRSEFWMYQANTYIATGEPAKAAANLELVRRMGRISREARLLLGDIYVNEDLPRLALRSYGEAREEGAPLPFPRLTRAAERLSRQGHAQEAAQLVAWMEEDLLATLSPREVGELQRLKARLALASGNRTEARSLLEQALEVNPLDGESLLLLAAVIGQADLEHAEVLLMQAARLPETTAPAYRQHGELLARSGRYAEALDPLQRAQALEPSEALRRFLEQVERMAQMTGE